MMGRYCLILLLLGVIMPLNNACETEEEYGIPEITGIRTTDPALANVPVDTAGLGQLIVIHGHNLASTQQIFFNSEEAFVNPVYVTDVNVIVRIPSGFPSMVNDTLRLITLGGETRFFLPIAIPTPMIRNFPLEWVPEGGTLTINGEFFYNVSEIEFPGGTRTDNFTLVSPERIDVIVPTDVGSGPVTVHAAAGTGTSTVWFRDNRGMMIDFDNLPICWGGPENVVSATALPPGHPVRPISDNFFYINRSYLANSWWNQESVIAYCGAVSVTGVKENFALAFEMWVGDEWNSNWWQIQMHSESGEFFYEWRGYNTPALGGPAKSMRNTGWITVKIPLSDITAMQGNTFRFGRVAFQAQHADRIEFAFDNFRLIPLN